LNKYYIILIFLISVSACSSEEETKVNGSFSGTWDTDWGAIIFTQSGSKVTGTGRYRFDGNVEKGTLKANYVGDGDEGTVEFTLVANGDKFYGEYVSSVGAGSGYWSGKLIAGSQGSSVVSIESSNLESGLNRPINTDVQKTPVTTTSGTRQSWAVIVGLSKYENAGKDGLGNLIFADNDAIEFARTLKTMGWSESNIKLLINEDATKRNIEIAIESWLTKSGPQDQIILFWAGHGYPDPENQEKVYFTTYDTKLSIPSTGYRMDRVRSAIEELKSKNVVILADTCHAGKLITRGKNAISILPEIQRISREKKVPGGWIYMVSAAADRLAIEHSSWTNGAFTHTLLKGLAGEADGYQSAGKADNIITMGELKDYMNIMMPNETQKVLGVAKHPVILTSTGNPEIWNLTFNQN